MSPHCSGPCDQGRRECPTPEACEVANVDIADAALGVAIGVALVVVAVVIANLLALWWLK